MIVHKREDCRVCRQKSLMPILPLEPIPVASPNIKLAEADASGLGLAPLVIYRCDNCGHVQLLDLLDPEFQYKNFQYTTSISLGLTEHFAGLASNIAARLGTLAGKYVLEIGSNDGTLLEFCSGYGARVLGIDPAQKAAKIANDRGIPTLATFFTEKTAREILADHGRMDVIITNYTMANIDQLDGFAAGINVLLTDQGMVVVETSYALDVLEKCLIETLNHEHLSYFTVSSIRTFFERFGMVMVDVERIPTKGGSIRTVFRRKNSGETVSPTVESSVRAEITAGIRGPSLPANFMTKMHQTSADLSKFVARYHGKRKLGIFGSAIGTMPMMSQFKLWQIVDFVADDQPLTEFFHYGNKAIPVIQSDNLRSVGECAIIIMAWRYAEPIVQKIGKVLGQGVPLALPFPDVREFTS